MIARLLPRPADYAGLGRSWRRDIVAGATVGVVALPLALAFGISSGVGASAGLVTAVVAGIVAVAGLKMVATGDTVCDQKHPIRYETVVFPTPVIAVAIAVCCVAQLGMMVGVPLLVADGVHPLAAAGCSALCSIVVGLGALGVLGKVGDRLTEIEP